MPIYKYKEIDKNGKVIENTIEAGSVSQVNNIIRSNGKIPVNVKEVKRKNVESSYLEKSKKRKLKKDKAKAKRAVPNKDRPFYEKDLTLFDPSIKLSDIYVFCKQASTMLDAGMNLISTIEVLIEQTENNSLRKILVEVAVDLRKGYSFSAALKVHQKKFPPILISMVEAGEMTGSLDQSMAALSDHFQKEDVIQKKIKTAMMYPAILLVISTAVVLIMVTFVLPSFMENFIEMGYPIPKVTQSLLNISKTMQKFWYIYLAVGVALVSGITYGIKNSEEFKYRVDVILSNIPGIKTPLIKIATSRYSRTLSIMLSSGIPIVNAVDAASGVTNNQIIIRTMKEINEEIKKGRPFNILLAEMDYFPAMMVSMVAIGEETGTMEEMLAKTSAFYDAEMEETINRLLALIEPIMIVIMAIIIGYIVIAMFLPIVSMPEAINSTV